MDIQRVHQYKTNFDAIGQIIKSDDESQEVEVWFATRFTESLRICSLGKFLSCRQ